MRTSFSPRLTRSATAIATILLAACADGPTVAPIANESGRIAFGAAPEPALAVLRRASARYHNIENATRDGFIFLTGCEVREEGGVGIMYVHLGNLSDGRLDPAMPDALIYEPRAGGKPRLVAVELAIGYDSWTSSTPPEFLGQELEREDEFQVYGLHVWLWKKNPLGLFAETNPLVTC